MLPLPALTPAKLKYLAPGDDLPVRLTSPSGVHRSLIPLSLSMISSGFGPPTLMLESIGDGDAAARKFCWHEKGLSSVLSSPSLTRVVQPGVHPPIRLMKPPAWEEWGCSYLTVCWDSNFLLDFWTMKCLMGEVADMRWLDLYGLKPWVSWTLWDTATDTLTFCDIWFIIGPLWDSRDLGLNA